MGNFIKSPDKPDKSTKIKIGRRELEFPENTNTSEKLQIFLDKINTETLDISNELDKLREEINKRNKDKGDNDENKFIAEEERENDKKEVELDKKNIDNFLEGFDTKKYDDFFKNFKTQMEDINSTRQQLIRKMEEKYSQEYSKSS